MEAGLKELAAVPAYAAAARAGAVRPPAVRRPRASTTVVKSSGGGGIGWIVVLLALGGGGWYYYTQIHQKPEPSAPVAEEKTEVVIPREERPRPQRPVDGERKMELPGVAQEESPSGGGSRIFDTPTSPLGSPMPERPKVEGPKPLSDPQPFLIRARDIMTKKSYDVLTIRQRVLRTNIDNFDREVSRAARQEGAAAVSSTARAIKAIRENNDRIPDSFKIEDMQDMTYSKPLSEAVRGQEAADEKFHQDLKSNADIYIRGINMEIQRRQQANDAGAVILLKEEIEKVQSDSEYFGNLIGAPRR
ncbi:MAG: hypothetical protein EOP87_27030 [Verrucomicrobiaceae bacterium]|nr:MAG: hypothetical protein EOP87_27030 [Verrucomicrobiaceae bacterium]